ncbi:hypothetical protein MMMDOFMJ_4454 [Methylobacterium gnaphalii]|uniref:Uncharacterized protein n=1 Tax=Methylobacterium gnaphalii TaxID=1010610 RepID=A0A512JPS4_9HYPH|nr:hypothetical protein MGN01_37080 [Methylobacterium gnaphalii]GJD71494.1 hypothetical protein MMMDOFMJ_4454 [Methylobacterium gnaphalii]GLS47702.1 hypothetical protein GCM10007885_05460 [Methylobacterium gnaphalii]
MRNVKGSTEISGLRTPPDGRVVGGRSGRNGGTAERSRTLSGAMPLCRINVPQSAAASRPDRVRVSHYVVGRRAGMHPANDNRGPRGSQAWQWAIGIAVAPALGAILLLSGLF